MHPRYERWAAWIDNTFDAENFDVDAVNRRLEAISWSAPADRGDGECADEDDISDGLFDEIDTIDMEYGLRHAGRNRHGGYVEASQAAYDTVAEILEPYVEKAMRYYGLGMPDAMDTYTRGVILGLYQYEQDGTSDFKDWIEDVPVELAGDLLRRWRERTDDAERTEGLARFILQRCPEWAEYLP